MQRVLGFLEGQGDLAYLLSGADRGVLVSLDLVIYLLKMCRVFHVGLEGLLPGPLARLVWLLRLAGFRVDVSGALIEGLSWAQGLNYLAWSLR